MTQVIPAKGKLIIAAQPLPGLLFEVYEDTGPEALGVVGYCNGERSVAAGRADIALRGLQKKHLPPKVVCIAEARQRLRD